MVVISPRPSILAFFVFLAFFVGPGDPVWGGADRKFRVILVFLHKYRSEAAKGSLLKCGF